MTPPGPPADLARAYAACEAVARAHYENFPVASRLLPPAMRPHVAAVYAFARVADDLADEGNASAAERQAALAEWQRRLHDEVRLKPDTTPAYVVSGFGRTHVESGFSWTTPEVQSSILLALAHSIRTIDLPLGLFDDLVSAFAQDTRTTRWPAWTDVMDYCRRSANPIGRLVLRIAGWHDDRLDRSSDALCTALQLTNFWQDFGRDWHAGRLYVPRETSDRHGASEDDLRAGELTGAWRAALAECVAFTRAAFDEGRAVCDGVSGRLKFELRLTWLGGARILERVDWHRASLLEYRPALGAADVPVLAWRAARWRTGA